MGAYGALWFGVLALFFLRLVPYSGLSPEGAFGIFGSLTGFLIGCFLGYFLTHGRFLRNSHTPQADRTDLGRLDFMMVVIGILGVIASGLRFLALVELLGLDSVFSRPDFARGSLLAGEVSAGRLWDYLISLNYAGAPLGGYMLRRKSLSWWPAYLPLVGSMVNGLAWWGREGVLDILILYAASYLMVSLNKRLAITHSIRWKDFILLIVVGGAVLTFMYYIGNMRLQVNTPSKAWELQTTLEQFYVYTTGPLAAFDLFVRFTPPGEYSGTATLYALAVQLYDIGLLRDLPEVGTRYGMVLVGGTPVNVYTYLRPFYEDFGLGGTVLLPLLIGTLSSVAFIQYKRNSSLIIMVLLSNAYFLIGRSTHTYFFYNTTLWIALIVATLVAAFSQRRRLCVQWYPTRTNGR
jgi:oligosaccharide repeat unit polymerase